MKRLFIIMLGVYAAVFAALWLLTGCASAGSIRKQVAGDLNGIIQSGDCPTVCAAVKAYVATHLK